MEGLMPRELLLPFRILGLEQHGHLDVASHPRDVGLHARLEPAVADVGGVEQHGVCRDVGVVSLDVLPAEAHDRRAAVDAVAADGRVELESLDVEEHVDARRRDRAGAVGVGLHDAHLEREMAEGVGAARDLGVSEEAVLARGGHQQIVAVRQVDVRLSAREGAWARWVG